jgi:S1-C subfamily serine protease
MEDGISCPIIADLYNRFAFLLASPIKLGNSMNEPPVSRLDFCRKLGRRLKTIAKRVAPFVATFLAAILVMLAYNAAFPGPVPLTARDVKTSVAQMLASATPKPSYSSKVYQIIQPSLVLIETSNTNANDPSVYGLGSGVVVDKNADILTSLHVVKGVADIKITFADGSQSVAKIVGTQPDNDIAVLQPMTPPNLVVPAILGNPASMHVGDEAIVVGNPFGLYGSLSTGVISGFNRLFKLPQSDIELHGMIQIDAAVNPGNSGGPLLNRSGEVIGIITGIINPTDQNFFVGIGFAVPINVVLTGMGQPPLY